MLPAEIIYGVFLLFPLLVFMAGFYDLYSYQIPNMVSLILIAGFYIFAIISPAIGWEAVVYHSLTGFLVLMLTFALFCFGLFGGGDAKILAASALWIGPSDIGYYLMAVTVAGGILSLAIMFFRAQACYPLILKLKWLSNLYFGNGNKRAVPYAVAIAGALSFMLHSTTIYKIAIS